jgi:hypothetical protein
MHKKSKRASSPSRATNVSRTATPFEISEQVHLDEHHVPRSPRAPHVGLDTCGGGGIAPDEVDARGRVRGCVGAKDRFAKARRRAGEERDGPRSRCVWAAVIW